MKNGICRIYGESHQKQRGALLVDSVVCTLLSERKLGPHVYGILQEGRLEEFVEVKRFFLHLFWFLYNQELSSGCFITCFGSAWSEDLPEGWGFTRGSSSNWYAVSQRTDLVIYYNWTVRWSGIFCKEKISNGALLLDIYLIYRWICINLRSKTIDTFIKN